MRISHGAAAARYQATPPVRAPPPPRLPRLLRRHPPRRHLGPPPAAAVHSPWWAPLPFSLAYLPGLRGSGQHGQVGDVICIVGR